MLKIYFVLYQRSSKNNRERVKYRYMVKYLKFNLLVYSISVGIVCLNKAKLDSEPPLSYSVGLTSLLKFVTVVHGSFYSYKELVVNCVW